MKNEENPNQLEIDYKRACRQCDELAEFIKSVSNGSIKTKVPLSLYSKRYAYMVQVKTLIEESAAYEGVTLK